MFLERDHLLLATPWVMFNMKGVGVICFKNQNLILTVSGLIATQVIFSWNILVRLLQRNRNSRKYIHANIDRYRYIDIADI